MSNPNQGTENVSAIPDPTTDEIKAAMGLAWDQGYRTAMFDKEYYSHNANPYKQAKDQK